MNSRNEELSSESRLMNRTYLVIFIILISWNIWFYFRWNFLADEKIAVPIMLSILDLYWLIFALIYRKQANISRYRNADEPDDGRKVRTSLGKFAFALFFFLTMAIIVKKTAFSMTDYIYKSRVFAEQDIMNDIQKALTASFNDIEIEEEKKKVFDELCEGLYINDRSKASSDYWEDVFNALGDYTHIAQDFRLENKKPELFVQMIDDSIVVELKNSQNDMYVPMIAKGKN